VSISEKVLAGVLKQPEAAVVAGLKQLAQQGMVEYAPKKETPQLFFLYHRVPENELVLDQKLYNERQKQYTWRVAQMAQYATNASACRSVVLRRYFADTSEIQPCGICDVCLSKHKIPPLTTQQLEEMATRALALAAQPVVPAQLQRHLACSAAQLDQLLQYLLDEEKITYSHAGKVVLQKK
ncbi:MAG: hypothetical protein EAY75_05180, partial [Bacteroidetes bacterium]